MSTDYSVPSTSQAAAVQWMALVKAKVLHLRVAEERKLNQEMDTFLKEVASSAQNALQLHSLDEKLAALDDIIKKGTGKSTEMVKQINDLI